MHRRMLVVAAAAVSFLLVAMPGGSAQTGATTPPHHRLLPVNSLAPLAQRNADQDSLNWAGYAALPTGGHRVTAVSGSWTVPAAGALPPGFSATCPSSEFLARVTIACSRSMFTISPNSLLRKEPRA